jgi:hypothetical protein
MAVQSGIVMSDLTRLSEAQMGRIEPHFPLPHGVTLSMTAGPSAESSS